MKLPPFRAVTVPQAAPQPSSGFAYWTAGISVALVAVVVVGALLAAGLYRRAAAPSTASAVTPDSVSNLPFNCWGGASLHVDPAPALANVDAVRTSSLSGYDRVMIQFANGQPALTELSTQHSATFSVGAGGQTVTLKGQDGALLTLRSADGHTNYSGPTVFKTDYPVLLELRKVQDDQGTVKWAIGLSRMPCYRMFFVVNPVRLEIDFQAG